MTLSRGLIDTLDTCFFAEMDKVGGYQQGSVEKRARFLPLNTFKLAVKKTLPILLK